MLKAINKQCNNNLQRMNSVFDVNLCCIGRKQGNGSNLGYSIWRVSYKQSHFDSTYVCVLFSTYTRVQLQPGFLNNLFST